MLSVTEIENLGLDPCVMGDLLGDTLGGTKKSPDPDQGLYD